MIALPSSPGQVKGSDTALREPLLGKVADDGGRAQAYFGPRRPIPIGRIGEPEDIAGIATFLCSEHASWITGTCINVDGGWVKGV